jgi:preprotein translocase subunit SecY
MNSFKQTQTEPLMEPTAKSPESNQVGKLLAKANIMSYVSKDLMAGLLPYIFIMMLFALLYIGNSYHADKLIRNIDKTGKEIKELRSEYISGKSELMQKSKQSAVAAKVAPIGLEESLVPPQKIIITQ